MGVLLELKGVVVGRAVNMLLGVVQGGGGGALRWEYFAVGYFAFQIRAKCPT